MTNEFMKDCLLVMWNRRPGVLLRKWGTLVLDAFKGHRTPEIKVTVTGSTMDTDLVFVPQGMTSADARCCGAQTVQRLPKAAVL
jgi:hypothetical protein